MGQKSFISYATTLFLELLKFGLGQQLCILIQKQPLNEDLLIKHNLQALKSAHSQSARSRVKEKYLPELLYLKKDISPLERSETDLVLPKRNSGSETQVAKLGLASYYSDLIYQLIDFIVKIYYQLCCLAFHVSLEYAGLLSEGSF